MSTNWLRDPRPGSACAIVAEVAQSHDGSLGMAHAFIDAAAAAGADAIKFQTHIAAGESTPQEPWRKRFSSQDDTRYDYWRRMELTEAQWVSLKRHADDRGLAFLSSPFSLEAVELLSRVGIAAWKVASGEINNPPLLDAMAATGLPLIISTGMSGYDEIDATVHRLRGGAPIAVMQCTSIYPCPPEMLGLNVIPELRQRYDCAVGLSDHSGTIFAGLAAAVVGIELLEVHIALSREMFGPDVVASVTTQELRQLVEGVRFIERARANPVDKRAVAEPLLPLRDIFMKSVVAGRDLAEGTVLRSEDLSTKKPAAGIPASEMDALIGLRLRRSLRRDELIRREDLA